MQKGDQVWLFSDNGAHGTVVRIDEILPNERARVSPVNSTRGGWIICPLSTLEGGTAKRAARRRAAG